MTLARVPFNRPLPFAAVLLALASSTIADVFSMPPSQTSLEFVTVRDAGNPSDPTTGYGAVGHEFRIGRFEVTNAQYAAFLNAVAASDPNGLYSMGMAGPLNGAAFIIRTGLPGMFTYTPVPETANNPVGWLNWYDAARFVNWLHNGQAGAGTENFGVYALNGPDTMVGERAVDARYYLPTEDEWYKAAYYQPVAQGGDGDGYWLYPTRRNTQPSTVVPDGANYRNPEPTANPYSNVGTFAASASYYGTFDQGGNVWEFCETLTNTPPSPPRRVRRGGSYWDGENDLRSSLRQDTDCTYVSDLFGFRVASPVSPSGACCDGTVCTVAPPSDCELGVFQGSNTTCGPLDNPTTCCPANYNGAGGVSVQDIFDYLASYFAGEFRADFNHSLTLTVQDIFDYLAAYFWGCP